VRQLAKEAKSETFTDLRVNSDVKAQTMTLTRGRHWYGTMIDESAVLLEPSGLTSRVGLTTVQRVHTAQPHPERH